MCFQNERRKGREKEAVEKKTRRKMKRQVMWKDRQNTCSDGGHQSAKRSGISIAEKAKTSWGGEAIANCLYPTAISFSSLSSLVSLLLIFSLSLSLARLFIYDSLFFCTELQRAVRMRRQRLTEVIFGAPCVSEEGGPSAQRCAKASSIITYTRTHTPHTHTYV